MTEKLFKYQGAGNDFVIIDNRDRHISPSLLSKDEIRRLCNRHYGLGSDGLMLLEAPSTADCDFKMSFFNPDGSGGMMCGNGGRCIVAFAAFMGVPARKGKYIFEAPDGVHEALLLKGKPTDGTVTVRLKMNDVTVCCNTADGMFLDTGTRHLVVFKENVEAMDVVAEGRPLRYSEIYAPVGTNVNFVEFRSGSMASASGSETDGTACDSQGSYLAVRTYEKGVEDETEACGTGITASAIASFIAGFAPESKDCDGRCHYRIKARRDYLKVDFMPQVAPNNDILTGAVAKDIWLTGPATRVAECLIDCFE